jgi:5-methylcytosine-specific restriction protein B
MLAEKIREFVFKEYIDPARKQGMHIIIIRAGDIHKKMKLSSRMSAVCGAIGTIKFQNKYYVQQIKREGPTQGANATFTFKI